MLRCVCAGSLGARTVALGQAAAEAAAADHLHGAVERPPASHPGLGSHAGEPSSGTLPECGARNCQHGKLALSDTVSTLHQQDMACLWAFFSACIAKETRADTASCYMRT